MLRERWKCWKERQLRSTQSFDLKCACATHVGMIRTKNEDNWYFASHFLPLEHSGNAEPMQWRCSTQKARSMAIFDGMGGESAGDLASFVSASQFHKRYPELIKNGELPSEETISRIMVEISNAVHEMARKKHYRRIGSTAAIFLAKEKDGVIVNLGDSPIYRLRNGTFEMLSHAHTDQELIKRKGIKRKPALTQFLGIAGDEFIIEPYIKKIILQSGDQYLLCSDGLTDMVTELEIQNVLNRNDAPKNKVEALMKLTLNRGAIDNTTIILCEVF